MHRNPFSLAKQQSLIHPCNVQVSTRQLGKYGEDLATEFLVKQGWEIIDRNWRMDRVELDIVARDADTVVFCEVKTRRSNSHGVPAEAVTKSKLNNIRRAALHWLACHDLHFPEVRFDVIGVTVPRDEVPIISHIKGIQL